MIILITTVAWKFTSLFQSSWILLLILYSLIRLAFVRLIIDIRNKVNDSKTIFYSEMTGNVVSRGNYKWCWWLCLVIWIFNILHCILWSKLRISRHSYFKWDEITNSWISGINIEKENTFYQLPSLWQSSASHNKVVVVSSFIPHVRKCENQSVWSFLTYYLSVDFMNTSESIEKIDFYYSCD